MFFSTKGPSVENGDGKQKPGKDPQIWVQRQIPKCGDTKLYGSFRASKLVAIWLCGSSQQ